MQGKFYLLREFLQNCPLQVVWDCDILFTSRKRSRAMAAKNPPRKRPELLLGAAALCVAAGTLLLLGARGVIAPAPSPAPTTAYLGSPFEAAETQPPSEPAVQAVTEPASYVVGYTGIAVYAQQTAAAATAAPFSGPVNINTAAQAQLETLPGIGPAKAQAILEWRAANGRFTDPAQLLEVSGIGEKTLMQLLPFIVF